MIMNEAVIIVSTLAVLFSFIALLVSCIAISMVCGFLRSTHTIQWKTLDNPHDSFDPLLPEEEIEEPIENPLKAKRKPAPPEDYKFMEDVSDHTNF